MRFTLLCLSTPLTKNTEISFRGVPLLDWKWGVQMCDYDSDESSIHLYDIPEFPGYDQPQANTEVRASTQRVELYSSGSPSSGRDLIGEASTRDYSPEEESTVDYSSGEDLTDEESPGEVSIVVNQPRQVSLNKTAIDDIAHQG